MNATAPDVRRGALERWSALGAVAYVILFIVGAIVSFSGTPDGDAPPAEVIRYYSDSGHRDKIGVGWILVMLGVFFFLWFLTSLRQALRRLDAEGFLTRLAWLGGAIYATLTAAGISLEMAIKTMSDDTFQDRVYPELIHAANDVGYIIHSAGGVGVGTMMIAASAVALRARAIPAWAGWVGVAAGVLALGSIAFFPQFLIARWRIAAGEPLERTAPAYGAHMAPR
jgi:hypothetical protein